VITGLSFGADWYPEQWDGGKWSSDADRMREFGIDIVRMMEFAWAVIEPQKGSIDFSLFDRAIDVLSARGIRVILGTPTATFPAWLLNEGDVLQISRSGMRRDFGSRRAGCFNSPAYREASMRIVRACAEHFGSDERVVGWQVDNEIGTEGSDYCVCENCRRAWHLWLERRYGDPSRMNAEWGTVFWGAAFPSFDHVPVPREQPATGFNPGLLLDYRRFCSDSIVSFAGEQVSILRSMIRPDAFITTNLYSPPFSNNIDYEELVKGMDFASWNNYPTWGDSEAPLPYFAQALAESFVRCLRGAGPYTVLESFCGIQGHDCLGYLPSERQAALWTNQAVARGADKIVYFRWRTAPFGQEQLCYGLRDTDDEETERFCVLHDNASATKKAFARFASTPIDSPACLVYSKDSLRVLSDQYLSKGLYLKPVDWVQAGTDMELVKWFAPYVVFNVNADVKSTSSVELDKYRVVSLPLCQITDPVFVGKLESWVRSGGCLVLGYRSGARDARNWNISDRLPGLFADMAGVRVPRFESLGTGEVGVRIGMLKARGEVWADIIEPTSATVAGRYADKRKFYSGLPCVTVNRYGSGCVWYIGTSLDSLGIFLLYRRILKQAGLSPRFLGMGIEVIERIAEDGQKVKVVLNHTPKAKLAFGRRIPAYGWAVIE